MSPERVCRSGWPRLLALLLALAWAGCAQAELRALLVGVTGYPTLDEKYRLQGPRNDVLRMRQVLLLRGFAPAQIRVLADGVADAAAPTRAAILGALDSLAREARPGDTVFIHFAGHGSRQPADGGTALGRAQPNGLHETFLPLDVGGWDGSSQTVKNAIVDFELRAAVDRISERGAFVWGVFDACHSATLVRGGEAGSEVRWRYVEARDLGIPQAAINGAKTGGAVARASDLQDAGALGQAATSVAKGRGGSVFFYASQTTELTPELPLPLGASRREVRGLFSFFVARAMERAPPMSYRQLAQYILAEYGGIAEARVTPLFSGNALDDSVLGQKAVPLQQWPLAPGSPPTAPVGMLSGVDVGAVFAVVPGPLAQARETIGHLQVRSADATRVELEPVAWAGREAPPEALLKAGQYLRLVHNPLHFALSVATDASACARDCELRIALQQLKARGVPGVDVRWVGLDGGPDIVVQLHEERVLFLSPTRRGDAPALKAQAPGLPALAAGKPVPADELERLIGAELHLVARARNLLRLAGDFAVAGRSVGLVASLKQKGTSTQDIGPEKVPVLHDGDVLALAVDNPARVPVDLTVLYVDADYGVGVLFPNQLGESNRLEAGSHRLIDGIEIHAPPDGIERLVLIAVEAGKLAERADFSFLQQPALTRQRGQRGQAPDEYDVFADAAFADFRTRGAARPAGLGQRTQMQVYTLRVQR